MQKKRQEKNQKPNFNAFKLQRFTDQKKKFNLKKNQINFVRTKKKKNLLLLCDHSKLIFLILFKKDIK